MLLALGLAAPEDIARAQDPAPPAPAEKAPPKPASGAAAALDAAALLVKTRSWAGADAAYRKALAAFPDDPVILARLARIEADLRRCAFQRTWKAPPVKSLFPVPATDFRSGIATFRAGATTGLWRASASVLECVVPFEGEVSVAFSWKPFVRNALYQESALPPPMVYFCWDSETESAYAAGVELAYFVDSTLSVKGFLREVQGNSIREFGKPERLALSTSGDRTVAVRMERKGTSISVYVRDKLVVRGSDSSGKKGGLGLLFGESGPPDDLEVTGRVDPSYVRRMELAAEDEAYRAFSETWDRSAALPDWIRAVEARREASVLLLPGAHAPATGPFAAALRSYYFETPLESVPKLRALPEATGDTARYIGALLDFALGEYERADLEFATLANLYPDFSPAAYHVVLCAVELGRANAATLAETFVRDHPDFAPGWVLAARLARDAGDSEKARAILEESIAKGIVTPETYALRESILRRDAGPDWARRFESNTTNYSVRTDHSAAVAADVAKLLEDARTAFVQKFRLPPKAVAGKQKPVVYVFANQDGYDAYTGTFGAPPGATAGLYFPSMRQLCVWLHDDRAELVNTIRHEGFHQYLHGFVENAPIWFNEGYAEYFGFSRRSAGKVKTGQAGTQQRALLAILRPGFSPLSRLLSMDQRAFLAKPEVHYLQAWSFIHYLRESKSAVAKGLMEKCTEAVFAGKSAKEVYREVFEPNLRAIEADWLEHVSELAR